MDKLHDFENEIATFDLEDNQVFENLGNFEAAAVKPRHENSYSGSYFFDKKKSKTAVKQNEKKEDEEKEKEDNHPQYLEDDRVKLELIEIIQNIAKSKPLGEKASLSDWDHYDNLQRETIAMMRYCGFEPATDNIHPHDFNPKNQTQTKDFSFIRTGKGKIVPLLLNEKYFKLRPAGEEQNTDDLIDWKQYTRPDGSINFYELKKTLEDKNSLARRIAKLNNIPESLFCNHNNHTEEVAQARPTVINSAQTESRTPWSQRKSGSLALKMAMSAAQSPEPVKEPPPRSDSIEGQLKKLSFADAVKTQQRQQSDTTFNINSSKYLTPKELYAKKRNK